MTVMATREAAGAAVFSPDGRLLLGLHSHDGRWATIGGGVESGQSHEEAARREVREEVGLEIGSFHLLGVFADSPIYEVAYPDGSVVRYAVTMYATVLDVAAEAEPDGQEILDVAWVAPGGLEEFDLARDMAQIVPAAFRWMAGG